MRLLLSLVAALLPATAASIYDKGIPNGLGAWNSGGSRVVEDASLASIAANTGLRFWTAGVSSSQSIADLTWAVQSENAEIPGPVVDGGSASNFAAFVDGAARRRDLAASFNLTVGEYFIEFAAASTPDYDGPTIAALASIADMVTGRSPQGDE